MRDIEKQKLKIQKNFLSKGHQLIKKNFYINKYEVGGELNPGTDLKNNESARLD